MIQRWRENNLQMNLTDRNPVTLEFDQMTEILGQMTKVQGQMIVVKGYVIMTRNQVT
jgi:hypothetical protein